MTWLPKGSGQNAHYASTLGGWQLMVNPNSGPRRKKAAIRLVEYLTDEDTQMSMAIETGRLPTLANLYDKNQLKDVLAFIRRGQLVPNKKLEDKQLEEKSLKEILLKIDKPKNSPTADNPIVKRPSSVGKRYPAISKAYADKVSEILQYKIKDPQKKQEEVENLVKDLIKAVENQVM